MKNWWKERVFYEIYMPSFMDGSNDGLGDFEGIISKLDYLKYLGIGGVWLTPFYPSPKVDNGYDISDYCDIDPSYGDLNIFKKFIDEANKRDIKVIIDIVLNHTSDKHKWFIESRSSKNNKKRDFYIWKENIDKKPPNNWESFFGGCAWELDETTNEYYYHAFAKEQVDLNWSNPKVLEEMKKVLKFWIDLGVDGFRFDVINFLKVNNSFEDNPLDKNNKQDHVNDKDQEGILDVIKDLVKFIKTQKDMFLIGEVGSEDINLLKRYCGKDLLDVVFNFNLGSQSDFNSKKIFEEIKNMNNKYNKYQYPTLFFGSHDMPRYISRFSKNHDCKKIARAISTLMLTAKGVPFVYYGDEIGMTDLECKHIDNMNDIQGRTFYDLAIKEGKSEEEALKIANEESRDKSRSPMQWSEEINYGFSKKNPWIYINDREDKNFVESQINKEDSLLNHYKKLIKIRKEYKSLQFGDYIELNFKDEVLTYIRSCEDEKIRVVINFSDKATNLDSFGKILITTGKINDNRRINLEQLDVYVEKIH